MDLGRLALKLGASAPHISEDTLQDTFNQVYNALYTLGRDIAVSSGGISLMASEQILKGQAVQIYAGRIRRANSASSQPACGISIGPAELNEQCRVMLGSGYVGGLSGLTAGSPYYVGVNGLIQPTPPGSGMVQGIAFALSDTELFVCCSMP